MAGGFKAKESPIERARAKAAETTVYSPPPGSLTLDHKPEDDEVIGAPPTPHMAKDDGPSGFMTDATISEIEAGKLANHAYGKRRKAEMDYGRALHERRQKALEDKDK